MIDFQNEHLLSLSEAARSIPAIDGRRPHPSTLFRWMVSGIRGGVRLEHARIGRRMVTSKEALQRFIDAVSEAPAPQHTPAPAPAPKRRTEKQRARDIAAAKKRLAVAGVLDKDAVA